MEEKTESTNRYDLEPRVEDDLDVFCTDLFDLYEFQIETSFRNGEFDYLILRDMDEDKNNTIIDRILHTTDNYIKNKNSEYCVFSEKTEIIIDNLNFTDQEINYFLNEYEGKLIDDDIFLYRPGYIGFEFIFEEEPIYYDNNKW